MKGFGTSDFEIEEQYCDVELEGVALVVVDPSSRNDNARRLSRPLGSASHWTSAASASRFKSSSVVSGAFNRLGSSIIVKKRIGLLVTLLVLVFGGVYYLGMLESKDETIVRNGEVAPKMNKLKKKKKKGKVGLFTQEHLTATRIEATNIITLLEEYYFSKEQTNNMLLQPWLDPWSFDDTDDDTDAATVSSQENNVTTNNNNEKQERNIKLIDTLARALVNDDQHTFLISGIGSSVFAGHDNCHYDSYQSQMERLWSPVWQAAGMEFVFQNAGEGGGCGDSYSNQNYCFMQNANPNSDIFHWSWTYFGDASSDIEMLIRWTQLLPKQPSVHGLQLGLRPDNGAWNELAKHYSKVGFNMVYKQQALVNGGYNYTAEGNNPDESKRFNRFEGGYVGDGYHNTTRYGEDLEEIRKHSLGVNMRNWHPGPLGFQTVSDVYTYTYTIALLKALDLIEQDMDNGIDPRDTWSDSTRLHMSKDNLPAPILCNSEYCVVDEPPTCLNFELPTFGSTGASVEHGNFPPLEEYFEKLQSPGHTANPSNDNLNPFKDELQNWTMWHTPNDLWYMTTQEDKAYYQDREDRDVCRHNDACGGISAQTVSDGSVVFRLPQMHVGLLIICGMESPIYNNTNIEISYNNLVIELEQMDVYPNGKCTRLMKNFTTIEAQEKENNYLAIKVLSDMDKPIRITQVITM
jgi:hypothetical protein